MSEPVEIGPAPERLEDDFDPMPMANRSFDVSDENPSMLANHMRALQREVHAGFEMITQKLLTAIERLNDKFDDVADWKNEVTRWQASTTSRIADLERWQSQTDARLAALERPASLPPARVTKRPTRRGKKSK